MTGTPVVIASIGKAGFVFPLDNSSATELLRLPHFVSVGKQMHPTKKLCKKTKHIGTVDALDDGMKAYNVVKDVR
jgi:hypothetical protein